MEFKMEIDLWTEKYRPRTLGDIVGQTAIVERLIEFVANRTVPHCLFAGPPGTSKTTAAMALARDLFGETFGRNFMELNASDERGIDVVRKQIKNFARSMASGEAPFKVLVLDEADHLTGDAQHALRRTMETFAISCRMILICNYSNRIIPPIQSRCAIFKFPRLDDSAIGSRLDYIAKKESISLKAEGKKSILYLAQGDMRAAINLLQAASSTGKEITAEVVFSISGHADPQRIREMLNEAKEGSLGNSLETLRDILYQQGVSPVDLVRQIHREMLQIGLSEEQLLLVLDKAAEAEFRIAEGASGEVQLTAFLAAIGVVRG
ncbi:MAG: replication factor C small subunit [Candidatus Thorarchaeota archaeon]|nr:MAG: replication factor C small subunit [Candidatus Thorarchaeota archaeon]